MMEEGVSKRLWFNDYIPKGTKFNFQSVCISNESSEVPYARLCSACTAIRNECTHFLIVYSGTHDHNRRLIAMSGSYTSIPQSLLFLLSVAVTLIVIYTE